MNRLKPTAYVAKYLLNTQAIAKRFLPKSLTTLQFFQWEDDVVLAGMSEVLKFLKAQTLTRHYQIRYLPDGAVLKARQVVLELEGPYHEFGHYEGVIDGILSRCSSLATNARNCVKAARGKELIFMGDRADLYLNQPYDGESIAIGGIQKQVTQAQVLGHVGQAVGTMPHALIQMFGGDVVKALEAFASVFPDQPLVALVDFNNDVIGESLRVWHRFGAKLFGVRVDTARNLVDAHFKDASQRGVTPRLIKDLRRALDKAGAQKVKVIVSSGFSAERIAEFEKQKTPVDVYGVGAALMKIGVLFSADAVKHDGKLIAKVGRKYQPSPELKKFG